MEPYKKKLWQERKAKSAEQYVEAQLLTFAFSAYQAACTIRGITPNAEVTWSANGEQVVSKRMLALREEIDAKVIKELRSFRGDTAEIAKGRDVEVLWNTYRPVRVKFKLRSVVDRLADLGADESPAGG
jgi:hypothetical protein